MHDVQLTSLMAEMSYLRRRLAVMESEIEQLRRGRQPQLALPGSKVFAVLNAPLGRSALGATAERLARVDNEWVRSGNTFAAVNVFLNEADEVVEEGVIITAVQYEGVMAVDNFYCAPNDWLDEV